MQSVIPAALSVIPAKAGIQQSSQGRPLLQRPPLSHSCRSRSCGLWTLILSAALLSACVFPVTTFTPASTIIAADSSADHRALLTAAWADQIAFEEFRLQNLPRLYGPFTERPKCHRPVGRFCFNPDDAFGAYHYIPDPPSIATYRLDLIAALRDIAHRIPADDWTAGQRVRYAVEAGLYDEANQAALHCAGSEWWCAALAGYALHRGGDEAGAQIAFDVALRHMVPEERHRWLDPAPLLESEQGDSLRARPLVERLRFADRFWNMADPFLARPGNEILSEHLARRVEIQFQWAAGFLEGTPWGEDLDESVMRYGMPENRIRGMGATFELLFNRYFVGPTWGTPDLLSHYTMPGLELLPPAERLVPGAGSWNAVSSWPRAGYRLTVGDSLARWLPSLAHQTAVFRRRGAAAVVAAYDLGAHDLPADAVVDAGLALVPLAADLEPVATIQDGVSGRSPLVVLVEPRPALMSLELTLPAEHTVGRVRRELSIQPFEPGSVGMSEILLVDGNLERPDSLPDALATALGSNRVRPGDLVGLFWEMYGLDPADDPRISMSLRLIAAERGVLGRLGQIIGIVQDDNPTLITWEEETRAGERMPRSIALTVPDLPNGVHMLELTMQVDGSDPIVVRKELVVGSETVRPLPPGAVTRRPLLRRTLCGALATSLVVGNEGNLAASQEFRESAAFQDYWRDSWMEPTVVTPRGMNCFDWVRIRPDYFGHGPDPR